MITPMPRSMRRFVHMLILSVCLLVAYPTLSWGQSPDAPVASEGSEQRTHVVVLEMPGGAHSVVLERLEEMEWVEAHGQEWFVEQIKASGVEPNRLMRRPEALAEVMTYGEIALVVFGTPAQEGNGIDVHFVDADGAEQTDEVIEVTDVGQTSWVEDVRARVEAYVPEPTPPAEAKVPKVAEGPRTGAVGATPGDEELIVEAKKRREEAKDRRKWITVRAGMRAFQRDFVATAASDSQIAYRSNIFPGYSAMVEGYPFYRNKQPEGSVGMYARFQQGFDNFRLVFADGEARSVSATLLDGEAGFAYRFYSLSEATVDPMATNFALRVGAIYSQYSLLEGQDASRLPSTSTIGASIGASVRQSIIGDRVAVGARIDAMPYQQLLSGREELGEGSFGYGSRGEVSADVRLFGAAYITVTYGFSFIRHVLDGQGTLENYRDTDAFDFFQSGSIGASYWF